MATNNTESSVEKPPIKKITTLAAPKDSRVVEELAKSPRLISVINLVDAMMSDAYVMRASDVHIDPDDDKLRIRFRIDGVMSEIYIFPKDIHSEVITRIKVLAGLRTDEHQMAQDGRFKIEIKGAGFVDIRVSIAPTYHGENCVMRILAEKSQDITLEALGYSDEHLKKVQAAIERPFGMILVVGPTGSGKTTSLYSILKKLNTKEVSIITIEDPVEYSLEGVDQIQVNERTGLTFAHGLRFILRQDPNIIMVGEIRDEETAGIAINAAMTGHKLLSTLHANDAPTALPRLIEMHIEPFLIASTINIIIGQRLVRTICSSCKASKKLSESELENLKSLLPKTLFKDNHIFYEGQGCAECHQTGFRGRVGIHEILEITTNIRDLIMQHANASQIRETAIKNGMVTMLEDGFSKAILGITSIEEVLRVFRE